MPGTRGSRKPSGRCPHRAAVIGHVEWTSIARVERLPARGDVVHADIVWEGPAGGGAVAAAHLAELAGNCTFFTALGNDAAGARTRNVLEHLGVTVVSAPRNCPTRAAVSLVDLTGERTTTTLGDRLQPVGEDSLPWESLSEYDSVYFVAGDASVLVRARGAPVLVATSREFATVQASGVEVDALVGSAHDPAERCGPADLPRVPDLLVMTNGSEGGAFWTGSGREACYPAVPAPGPLADSYGVGDRFAAALTFALGAGHGHDDALALAAASGAECVTIPGPFALPTPEHLAPSPGA